MAFALALQSVHDLLEGHGQIIFTATTAIVVLMVLLIVGSTGTMLEALQVVGDGHDGEGYEIEVSLDAFFTCTNLCWQHILYTNLTNKFKRCVLGSFVEIEDPFKNI
ncbi:hypothetical protein V6N13_001803 [Hibiscus sabdariffa]